MEAKDKALHIAKAAAEKKAMDILLLDLREKSRVTDYFVICTGNSTPQVHAITQNIEKKMRETGQPLLRMEGFREAHWVLMDYGDVIAHVFRAETREFYSLERLWGDSPQAVLSNLGEFAQ
ncbi:MAG: ribosome silencing factor [Heliobacteriaceae bacterium]|nr:ribosome silencing factor [Heliobacteriaceae bacterium]MDD4586894.1 ribosome silencing factor [Heliobacteriaceae bacterium]